MDARPRILVIDDEDVVLDACGRVFEDEGFEVRTARDGVAGLEAAAAFRPDLVLVDLRMPGLSGLAVLEGLRDIDPAMVAVVITGYSSVDSAVEAMKRGAFDFLPKPFGPDELGLIARRGLERRRLVLETAALRREREMLREHFAAIVSHELRSPLAAVQQNLGALAGELAEALTEPQRQRLQRLQARLGELLALVQRWLRASTISVDRLRESFAPVSLEAVVARALETVAPQAVRKAVSLERDTAAGLPPVAGEEASLVEALVNLLDNGVKYTHPGGTVRVAAAAAGSEVTITVSDDGIGIAPEDLPHVFTDFFRAAGAPAGESGAGIGLALTRRIVEAHDGTIAVESRLGEGTRFTLRLPALAGAPAERAPAAAVPTPSHPGDPR